MSRLLINEHPLQVLPTLATKVGLNEAIFVQQLHYWLDINRKANRNIIDGVTWSYNTYAEWQKQFPFWSDRTLRRTVKSCEEQGLVRSAPLSSDKRNRTLYYTINYQRLGELELEIQEADDSPDEPPNGGGGADPENASGQNDHMGENAMTAASGQNDHMHSAPQNPPSGQSDHMGPGQDDQMHLGQNDHLQASRSDHMHIKEQRLPSETSTETSSKTSSSNAGGNEPDPQAALLTAADLEGVKRKSFTKRIASAINNRTKAELLKEVPARKAWDRLPEEQKAIAFKTAQLRKQTEETPKSFTTVLKEELDAVAGIEQRTSVSADGFVARHVSDPSSTQRSQDRLRVNDYATRAYEEAFDAAQAEGVSIQEAEARATRAQDAARRAKLQQIADERAREQEQLEYQRKEELLKQAALLGA